ncbi:MAG: hypothetical protein HYR60_31830, partial [Acidobacteria bacterium]|nr:hypothetical protein [Acidobacteriota bacterium]
IESPAGKEPLSLQFEANYPVRQMEADRGGPIVGEPAKSAGKFITCATRWKKAPVVSSLKCIVAGGQKPIPNGKLAALRFKIPVTADYGAYKVTVEEAQSVGADMKLVKLKKAEGTVTIGRAQ